jgi:hypothetical protein
MARLAQVLHIWFGTLCLMHEPNDCPLRRVMVYSMGRGSRSLAQCWDEGMFKAGFIRTLAAQPPLGWRRACAACLLLSMWGVPTSAFESDSSLDVPGETEQALISAATVSGSSELAVEFASATNFDVTPPQPGETVAPTHIQAAPLQVSFSNAQDNAEGSGLAEAALWLRSGTNGSWVDTGQRVALAPDQGQGSFEYGDLLGEGEYFFSVSVRDRAGNVSAQPSGSTGAKVILDNTPPVITLLGANPAVVEAGGTYIDPGATAADTRDGDLTAAIEIGNGVNTAVVGTYVVAYNVQDQAGNAAQEVSRTVQVVQPTTTYALTINQPPTTQGAIAAVPAPDANGRYVPGTQVTLTFAPTANYEIGSWQGATASASTPRIATLVMDASKTVGVTVVRATGTVNVQVNPDNAQWTVTDGDGATHDGTGDNAVTVVTGNVSIAYKSLDGFKSPASESGQLARGGTVNFSGVYQAGMDYQLSASRSLSASPGDTIAVPVNITTGENISGYSFQMGFDNALLSVASVQAGGLTGAWGAPASNAGQSSVQVSASGPALSASGGVLAVINFTVKDVVESASSELPFSSITLNTADGPATGVTSEAGLLAVEMGEFRWGDADGDGEVTAADATALLRYVTGVIAELPVSTAAGDASYLGGADVSGGPEPLAGAYDAGLILQKLEGLRDTFPADLNGDGFGPDLTEGTSEGSLADLLVNQIDASIERVVRMNGELNLDPGTTIEVPIGISSGARVLGYAAEVLYDPGVLNFVSIAKGSLTGDWLAPIINTGSPGVLSFAAAGPRELSGSGSLATLTFRVASTVSPGQNTSLQFGTVDLNDGTLPVQLESDVAEPKLNNLSPKDGADIGGTVVTMKGLNLGYVDSVYFGGQPASTVMFIPESGSIMAVAPAGTGTVDVTVSAVGQTSTLSQSFTYFPADIRLTLLPEAIAESGEVFAVPVSAEIREGSVVNTVVFILNYDRRLFAALETGKTAGVVTMEASTSNITDVKARVRRPGQLEVTVTGQLQNGIVCTCNLVSIGASQDTQSLLYISDVTAEGPEKQAAKAAGGAFILNR